MNTEYNNTQRLREIGKNIRSRRAYAGITAAQLADKSDTTPMTIHNLEHGKSKNPTVNILFRIADVLKCRITDLIS